MIRANLPRAWWLLHLALAGLAFQLSLNLVDHYQADLWLELPAVAGVGVACGALLLSWLRRARLRAWLENQPPRRFFWRVLLGSILVFWACLTAAWIGIYLVSYLLGFGIADTFRMLLLMPIIVGFYWPLILLFGGAVGVGNVYFLKKGLPG